MAALPLRIILSKLGDQAGLCFPLCLPLDPASLPLLEKLKREPEMSKIAEPMAKPFPIAAVVFPAESSTSVLSRMFSPIPVISAIPPALSAAGPYASIVSPTTRVLNIPIAATATPYIPASVNGTKIRIASSKTEPVAL